MPRPGYTNVPPSEERASLFSTIGSHLALDPEQHSARLNIIDYALRKIAQQIEGDLIMPRQAKQNWVTTGYPIGSRIEVPNPFTNKKEWATVTNHTTGLDHKIKGIMVRMDSGSHQEVEARYLSEDGSGVY